MPQQNPPFNPQTDPHIDPTTGIYHADPGWRRYQQKPATFGDALNKLKSLMPNMQSAAPTPEDPGYPVPPSAPIASVNPSYRPEAPDLASTEPVADPPPQSLDDFIRSKASFGKMGGPGDTAALASKQSSYDPNTDIALEGLQNARKGEAEDRALTATRTGDPNEAAYWSGIAAKLTNDMTNPLESPMARARGQQIQSDASNTNALQAGIGLPPGAPPTPGQAAGIYARQSEAAKVGSPLAVAQTESKGRENVANIQNQGAAQQYQALLDYIRTNPNSNMGMSFGKASIKPMSPGQMISPGASKAAQDRLNVVRTRIQNLQSQSALSPFQAIKNKLDPTGQAQQLTDMKAEEASLEAQLGIKHGAIPGQPGQPSQGGIPPEVQNLQPGQVASDPTTGESWINRNGSIERIR